MSTEVNSSFRAMVVELKFFSSVLCTSNPNALFVMQDFLLGIICLICLPAYQASQRRKRNPVKARTESGLHQPEQIYVMIKTLVHLRMMMEEDH